MKRLVILLVLLFTQLGFCGPTGWTWFAYNGHEYALTNSRSSWAVAEQEAISAGGHLATINDHVENMFIGNTFRVFNTSNYRIAWIGLEGMTYNNSWVSGEPVTYTNFAGGYGVNSGPSFYMHLYDTVAFRWNNHVYHDNSNPSRNCLGIVEIAPSSPVPAPGALILGSLGAGLVGWVHRRNTFGRA